MDYFELMRNFWDFTFENPEKIKPNHCALYCFIVEHCNRLGWKKKFGLPTTMTKDAIGIRSYNTYINTLNELENFGLIQLIEKSKNQYSSNIVAILNFDKAKYKALDKAFIKHSTKQSESIVQSISSIDKQYTINNKQETNIPAFEDFLIYAKEKEPSICKQGLKLKYDSWIENGWKDGNNSKISNWKVKILNTLAYLPKVKNELPLGHYLSKTGEIKRVIS
jgi:hypothetical protein